jgi:DNA-binding XRE family transcriptional regulator
MGEIGDFLRAHRAAIDPGSGALAGSGHRRVPGLRREELAAMAGVSAEYYTRIEQGRVRPSTQVVDAIARALGLVEPERRHLQALVRPAAAAAPEARAIPPVIEQIFASLSLPAIVVGVGADVLAFNALAEAAVFPFGAVRPERRNFVRIVFTEPGFRERDPDWQVTAERWVAFLRADVGRDTADARARALVQELCAESTDFAELWSRQRVGEKISGRKRFRHPKLGEYELDFATLEVADAPGISLIVYSAASGTSGERALNELSADQAAW